MSIYESLRTGMNDFGYGDRFKGYARMPVLNADQPAQIVGLTPPDKRPSVETLNLMPPFERFFIECALPPELRFETSTSVMEPGGAKTVLHETVVEIGMDVSVEHHDHGDDKDIPPEQRTKWHMRCLPFYKTDSDPAQHDPLCVSNFELFISLRADGFPALVTKATPEALDGAFLTHGTALWVGQDGNAYSVVARHRGGGTAAWKQKLMEIGVELQPLPVPQGGGVTEITRVNFPAAKTFEESMEIVSGLYRQTVAQFEMYLPLLYAINSLHNKRTVLSTVQHSRQVRRAAQRNSQQPPDQKTIVIKDFVTVMRGARKARAEGHQFPLGEVIGHYKTYGRDGNPGLFGKYAGTWFWGSFLR